MTDRWTPSQLARPIRWVLALEYGGGTWYLSDVAMTIDDGAGGTIVVSDGLLDVSGGEETIDLWNTDAPVRSVAVEFDLGIDVAALVEQGHDLAGTTAELAQLADGDAWTDRRPFAVGRMSEPQYGGLGESVKASVEQDVLIDETAEITVTTLTYQEFGAAIEQVSTLVRATTRNPSFTAPVVIGTPGDGNWGATWAAKTDIFNDSVTLDWYDLWVIAGHPVAATSITLVAEDGTSDSLPVKQITMPSGIIISYVEVNLSIPVPAWTNTSPTMSVKWDDGPGLIDQTSNSYTTAGDYIAWLLSLTQQSIDQGKVNHAREQLAAFKVSTYIDETVTVADYVREAVLEIVPVSFIAGPKGLYPYVWKWDATEQDAVAHLDVTTDVDISRETLVTYENSGEICNKLTIQYARNPTTDSYTAEIIASGAPRPPRTTAFYADWWSDSVLARSFARYGTKSDTLECANVYDRTTAAHIAAWKSRRWALPSRVVEYSCDQRWGWIEPGDFITMTDPDLAWNKKLCLVQSRGWDEDGTVRYALRVQEL